MKRLNVTIDDDLHTRLKLAVVAQHSTIVNFVAEAISEKLDRIQNNQEAAEKEG